MKITKAEFIKSAADKSGFLHFDKPVVAVCGRSNVGKSSFINMLSPTKKAAKTSRDPGRTRLVNYFDLGSIIVADLPGYGFALVSKAEKLKWAKTIEDFFGEKEEIARVLLLCDIRHKPSADDIDFVNYLNHYIIPFSVICTKSDKLGKTRVKPAAKAVADAFGLGESNVVSVSNETGYGKEAVLALFDSIAESYSRGRKSKRDTSEAGGESVNAQANLTNAIKR